MKSESDGTKSLCILSGLNRGAVIAVGSDPVLIGGTAECDALLSDASASEAVIQVSLDANKRLSIKPVSGDISKNGRAMRPDRAASLDDGSTISLGDVRIAPGRNVSDARHSVHRRGRQRTLLGWGAAGVVSLALFGIMGVVGGSADAYNASKGLDRTASPNNIAQRLEDPLSMLENEILKNDLSGIVSVAYSPSEQLLATGAVSQPERERWNRIVRWFDGRYGNRVALESRLTAKADGIVLPFKIVSIVGSPSPRIVIQNGDVFPLGSFLPGGWELRRIESETVILARDSQELSIAF